MIVMKMKFMLVVMTPAIVLKKTTVMMMGIGMTITTIMRKKKMSNMK